MKRKKKVATVDLMSDPIVARASNRLGLLLPSIVWNLQPEIVEIVTDAVKEAKAQAVKDKLDENNKARQSKP